MKKLMMLMLALVLIISNFGRPFKVEALNSFKEEVKVIEDGRNKLKNWERMKLNNIGDSLLQTNGWYIQTLNKKEFMLGESILINIDLTVLNKGEFTGMELIVPNEVDYDFIGSIITTKNHRSMFANETFINSRKPTEKDLKNKLILTKEEGWNKQYHFIFTPKQAGNHQIKIIGRDNFGVAFEDYYNLTISSKMVRKEEKLALNYPFYFDSLYTIEKVNEKGAQYFKENNFVKISVGSKGDIELDKQGLLYPEFKSQDEVKSFSSNEKDTHVYVFELSGKATKEVPEFEVKISETIEKISFDNALTPLDYHIKYGGGSGGITPYLKKGMSPQEASLKATIYGTFRDNKGNLISNTEIKLMPLGMLSMTNEKGEYKFENVDYGKYSVQLANGKELRNQGRIDVVINENLLKENIIETDVDLDNTKNEIRVDYILNLGASSKPQRPFIPPITLIILSSLLFILFIKRNKLNVSLIVKDNSYFIQRTGGKQDYVQTKISVIKDNEEIYHEIFPVTKDYLEELTYLKGMEFETVILELTKERNYSNKTIIKKHR